METDGEGILGDPKATAEGIRRAWEIAALAAMQEHQKAGEPVVTWDWQTYQVVLVSPDEFAVPETASVAEKTAPMIVE